MEIPTILPAGCTDPHGENQLLPAARLHSPVLLRDRRAALTPLRWDAPAARHELRVEAALHRTEGKQPPATGKAKATWVFSCRSLTFP